MLRQQKPHVGRMPEQVMYQQPYEESPQQDPGMQQMEAAHPEMEMEQPMDPGMEEVSPEPVEQQQPV